MGTRRLFSSCPFFSSQMTRFSSSSTHTSDHHHHQHHHCERGALFKCSYPACGATFSSRLAEKMHRAGSHPPRQSIHDAELLQKYIRRFQLTGSGGKPFGQGPLASYRTSWCGGMVNMPRCRTSRRRALFRLRVLILNVGTQQARAKNSSSIITKNMVTEDLTSDLSWLRSAPNTKHQTPKNTERPSRQRWERVTSGDAV